MSIELLWASFLYYLRSHFGLLNVEEATYAFCLLMGVWLNCCAFSKSFLVLLCLQVLRHCFLGDEIACTSHAVVLTETGFIFINLLILQLDCFLGFHVLEYNLVNVLCTALSSPCLSVLFVLCHIRASAHCTS